MAVIGLYNLKKIWVKHKTLKCLVQRSLFIFEKVPNFRKGCVKPSSKIPIIFQGTAENHV